MGECCYQLTINEGVINMISMKNVSKQFGDVQVLSDITLNASKGEIFGLLGPSGAGKTTIINILTNQLASDGGSTELGVTSKEVGLMIDVDGLFPRLTCLQNMQLFANVYKINKKGVIDALEQVGLGKAKYKKVNELSTGMRQRLAFARAILHKPKVLFLDEPTSSLDPGSAEGVRQIIRDIAANGTTVFLTTHNMEEAVDLCDYVALINKGVIVEEGSPVEICQKHDAKKTTWDLGSVFIKMTGVELR